MPKWRRLWMNFAGDTWGLGSNWSGSKRDQRRICQIELHHLFAGLGPWNYIIEWGSLGLPQSWRARQNNDTKWFDNGQSLDHLKESSFFSCKVDIIKLTKNICQSALIYFESKVLCFILRSTGLKRRKGKGNRWKKKLYKIQAHVYREEKQKSSPSWNPANAQQYACPDSSQE